MVRVYSLMVRHFGWCTRIFTQKITLKHFSPFFRQSYPIYDLVDATKLYCTYSTCYPAFDSATLFFDKTINTLFLLPATST